MGDFLLLFGHALISYCAYIYGCWAGWRRRGKKRHPVFYWERLDTEDER